MRIGIFAILAVTQTNYALLVGGIIAIPCVAFTAAVQPYKQNAYNIIDIIMLSAVVQMCVGGIGIIGNTSQFDIFCLVMIGLAVAFPLLYALTLILKSVIPKRLVSATKSCCQKLLLLFRCCNKWSVQNDGRE